MSGRMPIAFALCAVVLTQTCCAREAYILYSEPAEALESAASSLQGAIKRAEENGCEIRQIALGAGQGVGLGIGIGVGHGVGVGINVSPDCPDCANRELNKVVENSKTERDTQTEARSIFALAALAACPQGTALDRVGNRQ